MLGAYDADVRGEQPLMPVLLWSQSDSGELTNPVQTTRRSRFGAEEHRPAATALDREIDDMLDKALDLVTSVHAESQAELAFIRRWALGRALATSHILESTHLEAAENKLLWEALGIKCRLGIRNSGQTEPNWKELIPLRETDPARIERDVFARGLWLQEQEIKDAQDTFGSSVSNVREIHNRSALRSLKLRNALRDWFNRTDEDSRSRLYAIKAFPQLAKALAKRWPGRGPGAAKQPVHYPQDELDAEVRRALGPVAEAILSG